MVEAVGFVPVAFPEVHGDHEPCLCCEGPAQFECGLCSHCERVTTRHPSLTDATRILLDHGLDKEDAMEMFSHLSKLSIYFNHMTHCEHACGYCRALTLDEYDEWVERVVREATSSPTQPIGATSPPRLTDSPPVHAYINTTCVPAKSAAHS